MIELEYSMKKMFNQKSWNEKTELERFETFVD